MSANGSLLILNPTSTVEEVDLFNNLQNIVITNADEDVWKQIGKVNLNAHNPNHGAPDHLSMVNNLLGDNAKKRPIHGSTNLGNISQAHFLMLALSHPIITGWGGPAYAAPRWLKPQVAYAGRQVA